MILMTKSGTEREQRMQCRNEERMKPDRDYICAIGFIIIFFIALTVVFSKPEDNIDGYTRPTPQPKSVPESVR